MRGSVNKEKYIKVPSTTVIRYRLFIVPKLRNKRSANVAKQLKLRGGEYSQVARERDKWKKDFQK